MRRRGIGCVAGALALTGALVGLQPTAASAVPEPVKILIVGDSVAQGSAGDWTWRYRLHQMLDASGVDVDFVGPRDDVFDNVAGALGSEEYADPAFEDRQHAARWGMQLSEPDDSIASLVDEYDPDVVIETRGINDLTWRDLDADDVAELVRKEVADARVVDAGIDFVIAQLPQQWISGVDDYNTKLSTPGFAADLSQDDSTVVVADTGHGFVEDVDSWDLAHLAATGEVKMAAGVADALADLGVGAGAGTLPAVSNGHWGGATLVAEPGDRSARLTWVGPPGAMEEFVWLRDATAGEAWVQLPFSLDGTSWVAGGLVPDHRYQFRLQAKKGTAVADDYSNVVDVVPTAPPEAPATVAATSGPELLNVDWAPAQRASSYDVAWTSDLPGERGTMNVAAGPVVLGGLVPGRQYRISVVARNSAGTSAAATTRATPGLPLAPGRVGRVAVVPGSHGLDVTWAPVPAATAYDVTWVGRRLGLRGSATVTSPAVAIGYVLAGERYDITVTARNAGGSGPVATAVGVPRGPKVHAPARLRAEQIGVRRAQLTWRPRPAASSYDVQVRRHGRWVRVRTVVALSTVVGRLPRGAARFRVRSWHQFVPGPWSHTVRVRMR